MADVFFITEDLLKKRTAVNDNVDSGELRFAIITAQNLNIQEILGQDLYEKLKSDVASSSLTGVYKTLMDDYIVPATIAWSYYHALDSFYVKFLNVGLVKNSNEQGAAIDHRTLQFLKNNAKSTAEFYDNTTRKYLCANSSEFPEYTSNDVGNVQPQKGSGYRSSIALDPYKPRPDWYGK